MADPAKFVDDIEYVGLQPKVHHDAAVISSVEGAKERAKWKHKVPAEHDISEVSQRDAFIESTRCLKCADAPCTKSCPCHIDLKSFMYAVTKEDYYAAGKTMYSDNPLALVCGYLCAASNFCRGGCNLNAVKDGPIDIPSLQRFACEQFQRMKLPQIRDPSLPALTSLPDSYKAPIAILGSGPASLSCAAFLSRLGYQKVTICEKEAYAGGVVAREIPDCRIPHNALKADIEGCLALGGVDLKLNTKVNAVADLVKDNAAVFLGAGLREPINLPIFKDAPDNLVTSRQFLTEVAMATKDLLPQRKALPKMSGHCIVLGGGDVAFDSASAALKCGADYVSIVYRENWPEIPANWEELIVGIREKLDFVSNAVPVDLVKENGKVAGVVCKMTSWNRKQGIYGEDQKVTLKCDHVVVAFGARAGDAAYLAPAKLNERGFISVNEDTQETEVKGVFAGGDCTMPSKSVVEGVNDGKTAAWFIHKHIQEKAGHKVPDQAKLPQFFTEVDKMDVSVDTMGLHFVNPFGLSSASPVTSVGMIKRAFDAGFGFAVTKTMLVDKDVSTNISPRIARSTTDLRPGPNQHGFINIELLTEKTPTYWVEGIRNMKREYPDRIVICSIMAQNTKEDWQEIAKIGESSGADALELNVSCPHTGRKGMGHTAGQSPEAVESITSWVKEVVKIPVITKLTPNVTNIAAIGEAAVKGGADALSAINTVSGIVTVYRDGSCWPSVGTAKQTAYGGVSGNIVRPIGLKAVSSIRAQESTKNAPILGIGGIDSAESAVQFILCGASVVQMTSSIQNQDYTIVDEMIHGLKWHLYAQSRTDLMSKLTQHMDKPTVPGKLSEAKATVLSECGRAVHRILTVPVLDLQHQVVADVDEDACIKCGKCYMSCNDTGYQAIKLDPDTHLPTISDKCMGCGLCLSVCPAACISYKKKEIPHHPDRGIPNPDVKLPFD